MRELLWVGVGALCALAACKGSTARLGPGEECTSSSECMAGLLCDLGRSPPVCSDELTEPPDAGPDATPIPADADLTPDAIPLPDLPPGTPDAMPMPDVPGTPDAGAPDAAPPDAAIPDAAIPDAT